MTKLEEPFSPVFVARGEGPLLREIEGLGIPNYVISRKGFMGFTYVLEFMKIMRLHKVDVVHLNTLTPFCKYAGIAAFLKHLPVVWVVREDPLISRSRRLSFWLRLLAAKIVFVDQDTRNKLLHGETSERIEVIYNGVDTDYFNPAESDFFLKMFGTEKGTLFVGYIGLLTRRKGLEYLIRAFSLVRQEYRNVRMVMIGGHTANDETYFSEIRKLIKDLALEEQIFFTGMLPDVRDALRSLDIVVLPSLDERCSRSLLEAISCGKAAVATRVGGTPEIIEDGVNGILVEPGNEEQIAKALVKLLANSKLREEMGKKGRERAERQFGIRQNIERIRELYLGLRR